MKNILAFCIVLLRFMSVYGQDGITDSAVYYDKIFLIVQQQPKFSGDVFKWVSDHIEYPKQAIDSNIQGTVFINFVIEKDGSVSSPVVLRGIPGGSLLDEEALRVVESMPKWTPGVENGHSVKVQFMLPVKFKLIEDTDKIYLVTQVKPAFPGDINNWLVFHLNYPEQAKNDNIQGSVYLNFVVEKDGLVSNVKVINGIPGGSSLDSEAVRAVSAMPKWKPGMQNGKPVRVQYMIPIRFTLLDQNSSENTINMGLISKISQEKLIDTIYTPDHSRIIQVKPQFPGDINKYLANHIKYPRAARNGLIEGTVIVNFIIEKDGSVSNVKIFRSVNVDLDNEAIRVISNMPKWIPGTQNGHPLRVQYNIPIHFSLR